MKLMSCSHVDISVLVGSLIVNPGGAGFIITGISFSLDDLSPWIHIKDPDIEESDQAISFNETLEDWSIQIGNSLYV